MKIVTQRLIIIQFLSKVFSKVTKFIPLKIQTVEQEQDELSSLTVLFFIKVYKYHFITPNVNRFSFENTKFNNQNHIFGVIFPQLHKSELYSMIKNIAFTYGINRSKTSFFNYNL